MQPRGFVRARDDDDESPPPTTASALNPLNQRPYSRNYYELLKMREALPVYQGKAVIMKNLAEQRVLLLSGETGSGKTTQIPQFLSEMLPKGTIACTQPRRVAAMSVAQRVAEEMDVRLGEEVGYHVRFDRRSGPSTRVLYLTDGMLLREFMSDGSLAKYSAVVVDEAHERTVDTDIALALLRELARRRTDGFKLVVMSATLDVLKFQLYFDPVCYMKIPGKMFHVSCYYTSDPVTELVNTAVDYVLKLHCEEPLGGDILVFLSGERDIERACSRTRDRIDRTIDANPSVSGAVVLPLYGSLSLDEQRRVFRKEHNKRKIIFATNIAETSLTIDGVVYVIDSGYHKQSLYNAESRVDTLLPTPISKASAQQRAGRAGRTREGKCFRMFTEKDFGTLDDQTYPEVNRTNMVDTMLMLLKLGVASPAQFPFLDPPSQQGFQQAYFTLYSLGAMDDNGAITEFGKSMADLPLQASLARMLLRSAAHGCSVDMAIIAAMLDGSNVFLRPMQRQGEADQMRRRFEHPDSDHITLLNVYHAFIASHRASQFCATHFLKYQTLLHADKVFNQLTSLLQKKEVPLLSTYNAATKTVNTTKTILALLEGFFDQIAYLAPFAPTYRTVTDKQLPTLNPQSVLVKKKPTWVMYHTMELRGAEGCALRTVTAVEPRWFLETNPTFFAEEELADGEIRQALREHRGPAPQSE